MVQGGNFNTNSINDDAVGDYRPGSIQRVKLQNFLTHGNVEFKPGPRYVVPCGVYFMKRSLIPVP